MKSLTLFEYNLMESCNKFFKMMKCLKLLFLRAISVLILITVKNNTAKHLVLSPLKRRNWR